MLGGTLRSRRLGTATTVLGVVAAASLVVPVLGTPVRGSTSVAARTGIAAPGETNLAATQIDLGTLGAYSSATDVDGTVVAGYFRVSRATSEFRAFAYDLAAAEPAMLDLGTLGGEGSAVSDVDGTVIVGSSRNVSGEYRAFAYDLAAADPVMQDLGTLGGDSSYAAAVDGTVIVGSSRNVSGEYRAFAYDLAAADPVMQDLGTLGGNPSYAAAVDGTVVVGFSRSPSDWYSAHAFAYDLAAADPVMQDLGAVGGAFSETYPNGLDVDGTVVVGGPSGSGHAFAYDLAAADPVMQDLGTLDGDYRSKAEAVDGTIVVGESHASGSYRPRAFAYDLAAPEPAMRDFATMGNALTWANEISGDIVVGRWRIPRAHEHHESGVGPRQWGNHAFAHDLTAQGTHTLGLGSWRGSEALDVDGDRVVGQATYGDSSSHATAWLLRETTQPMIAFKRLERRVEEGVGRATIRVIRYGRSDRAVTVHYRTRSDTAKAGKDFVRASGTLRFPRGVTQRSFKVKILDDGRREGKQYLLLTLSRPSEPALLGTPSWSQLRINKSDADPRTLAR